MSAHSFSCVSVLTLHSVRCYLLILTLHDRYLGSLHPLDEALVHEIFGYGIPEMLPLHLSHKALNTVGFAELAQDVPRYYPPAGDIRKAQMFRGYLTVWWMSWSGKLVSHNVMRLMKFVGCCQRGLGRLGRH